jgi:phosphoglycerate dehydrogenase-like enzyme
MRNCVTTLLLAAGLIALSASGPLLAQTNQRRPPAPVSTPLPEPDMAALIRQQGIPESDQPVRVFLKNWHRPKKIVVFPDNNSNRMAWLREVVPADIKLVEATSTQDGLKELADADAQLGNICNKPMVNAGGPNFEWIQDNHTGVDACFAGDGVPAKIRPAGTVVVTNIQHVISGSVGYHAVALMMALSRGMEIYARDDPTGKFPTIDHSQLWEMPGRTILVVGLGGIGSTIARLSHDLGMHVIATNATLPNPVPDYVEHVGLPDELMDLAPRADVVASGLPLTPQTQGIFNAAFFAKLKHGAMFINVTRGEENVEADMVAALKSGQLGSVGLDDYDRRPDNPLFTIPTALLTPHISAQASDTDMDLGGEVTWQLARENLRRFINGDKLLSVVDPARGY